MKSEYNNKKMSNLEKMIYIMALERKMQEVTKSYSSEKQWLYYDKIRKSLVDEILENGNMLYEQNFEQPKQKEKNIKN